MQVLEIANGRLVPVTRSMPQPGAGQVLIRTAYSGLNRADIFQRQGSYAPPPGAPDVPGLEVSGHIAAMGENVCDWQEGEPVCALLSGGGYSEYVLAQADHCLPLPAGLSLREAAALPECAATVWMALLADARLQPGEVALLHGGASGIGTTGIQMLRAYGCAVFVTVGSAEKAARCASLGATPILYRQQDFVAAVKDAGGVDAVLDIVGGEYIERSLQCLKPGGRLVSIAFLQGHKVSLSAGRLLMKRLHWMGATLRARNDEQKAAYIAALRETVWPWIEAGRLRPVIDSIYPLGEAEAAQEKMEKYLHCGKILLQVSGSDENETKT